MSLYRCEKCGCIENTALSNYHSRHDTTCWPAEFIGKKLCHECSPTHYIDGTPSGYGKWHGKFEKRSAVDYLVDESGCIWSRALWADLLKSKDHITKRYRIVGKIGANGTVVPL